MGIKLPLPTGLWVRLRPLLGGLRLVYLIILVLLVAETLFIVTRGIDDKARTRAETQYPSKVTKLNPTAVKALDSLQAGAAVAPASGKANPFAP